MKKHSANILIPCSICAVVGIASMLLYQQPLLLALLGVPILASWSVVFVKGYSMGA